MNAAAYLEREIVKLLRETEMRATAECIRNLAMLSPQHAMGALSMIKDTRVRSLTGRLVEDQRCGREPDLRSVERLCRLRCEAKANTLAAKWLAEMKDLNGKLH